MLLSAHYIGHPFLAAVLPTLFAFMPVLPDFSLYNIPKQEKMYQTNSKYTKWPQNIPNGRK
jgi:hypothetical protein